MRKPFKVGPGFPREVADIAHANDPELKLHNNGFCRACANIYLAVSQALIDNNE